MDDLSTNGCAVRKFCIWLTRRLSVFGLILTLVGASLGVVGVRVSPEQAIEIGVMRINGDNAEENLRLPAVQNLIHQSQMAQDGFVLIALGTLLQIVAAVRKR